MHELALAQDIVETINEKVTDDLRKISNINLEVGAFSGVVPESLAFGIETIFADKKVPGVKVTIVKVPTIACCTCGKEYELKEIFETCPVCRSFERKLISGMEILIKSVEVSEE
ncbi:MAG: hydrogenase maturation nickel metallochaperone HypA [Candidatus Aminicenantes bacterium]|nr:hydrogenase maturation nickel metallochaperone HypA [Candidatus Aminicenantes bacterium]